MIVAVGLNLYDVREMPSEPLNVDKAVACVRTLRLKVKVEAHSWLNVAAIEVNQVELC
jgi:hypothetical protein